VRRLGGSSRCGRAGLESSTIGAENAASDEGDNAGFGACSVDEAAVDLELVRFIGGSCAAGTAEAAAGTVEAPVALSVNSSQGIAGSKWAAGTATDLAVEEATSVAAGAAEGDVAAVDVGAGSRCEVAVEEATSVAAGAAEGDVAAEVKVNVLSGGSASDGEAADVAF
jgi:hypothetical protein